MHASGYDKSKFSLAAPTSAVNTYLNKSLFSDPAPLTLGTSAPRYTQIRGFGTINEDIGLEKHYTVAEKYRVQLRAELLNLFNRHTLGGININVTLLFGLPRYREVAEAYIAGIEARMTRGKAVKHVASVASFFVSRIDSIVDTMLEPILAQGRIEEDLAKEVRGQVAVASAKLAYQIYKEIFGSDRFKKLAAQGARVQRLLWASTSTKNPDYSDVKYVEALIGPDTVNTAPLETLDAYRDHGEPKARLEQDVKGARWALERLPELGISIDNETRRLEDEGVEKFNKPFDKMMETLAQRSRWHLTRES
jgi:transaldolase